MFSSVDVLPHFFPYPDSESETVNQQGHLVVDGLDNNGSVPNGSSSLNISQQRHRWELNYQEAAIYLQEGENNDKFTTHPSSQSSLPAYLITHNKWMYILDLCASLLLLFLAVMEPPAVPFCRAPVWVSQCVFLPGVNTLHH